MHNTIGYLSKKEAEVLSILIPVQQAGITDLCLVLNMSDKDVREAAIRLEAKGFIGFRNRVLWIISYTRLQGSLAGKGLWWLITFNKPDLRCFLHLKNVYYAPFSIQLMDIVDAFCIAKSNVFTSSWRINVGNKMILRTISPLLVALKRGSSSFRFRSLLNIVRSSLNIKLPEGEVEETINYIINLFSKKLGIEPNRIWKEVKELSSIHKVEEFKMSPYWKPKEPLRILVLKDDKCLALPDNYKGRKAAKRLSKDYFIFRGYPLKPIKLISLKSHHKEYEKRLMRILNKLPYATGEGDLKLLATEVFDVVEKMRCNSLTSIKKRELNRVLTKVTRKGIYSIVVRALEDIRKRSKIQ